MTISLDSSYEAIYERALYLEKEWRLDEAEEELERLVRRLGRLKPSMFRRRPELREILEDATDTLATLKSRVGKYDEAISLWQGLKERNPDESPFYDAYTAESKIWLGNVEQGLADLGVLMEKWPDVPYIRAILGSVLIDLRRYEQAREVLTPLVEKRVEGGEEQSMAWTASVRLLTLAEEVRDPDGAIRAWEAMERLRDRDEDEELLAVWRLVALLAQEGREEARRYTNRLMSRMLKTFLEGYLQWVAGDAEAARAIWARVEGLSMETTGDTEGLVRTALMASIPALMDAVNEFLAPFVTGRQPWNVFLLAGLVALRQSRQDEALELLGKAQRRYKEHHPLRRLPVHERRLWQEAFERETWDLIAPFFDEEVA